MALVVPSVARFAVNGTYGDRPVVNVLDFQIDTTGSGLDRDQAVYDTAGNIINSWYEHVLPRTVSQYSLQSVSWVDLNSLGGSTGSRVATSEHTLPQPGRDGNVSTVGNISVLVTKQTVSGRGRRNGRIYFVGLDETDVGTSDLSPTALGLWQDAMDDLLAELNDAPPVSLTRQLVVVHTTGPNPTTGTYTSVDQLVVQARVATQRRRLRA